ncbi:MAG: thioesterase [Alloprevotella sp.]|nr:thioesterase [Alloprevotella sp.]
MLDNPNIGTYAFTVQPFTEDFTGRISWSHLGNVLLRCAQLHADSHNFGFGPMSRERLSWVFSRLSLKFDRRPATGEVFRVSTWATDVQRGFTTRLFQVTDSEGSSYGWGHSIWALMHLDTRQPDDMQRLLGNGFRDVLVPTVGFPITGQPRMRVRGTEPIATRTVHYTDLDVNGHLNSIRSIDMLLDLFPKEHFLDDGLQRIDMAYAHECFFGDELAFLCDEFLPDGEGSQHSYNLEMRRADGQAAVRAHLAFKA